MKIRSLILCLLFSLMFLSQQTFASGSEPSPSLKTISNIMFFLRHYPAEPEMRKLKDIVNSADAKAYEKTLATAMINMQHQVSAADAKKLDGIVSDKSVPQAARDLAKVLKGINHKPSEADKAILKKYMWKF